MPLVPIKEAEIPVGLALLWDVLDSEQKVLRQQGEIIASEQEQRRLLGGKGLRRIELRPQERKAGSAPKRAPQAREEPRELRVSLEETHIQPGDRLQLQGESARYAVRLIGFQKGRSVIITEPLVNGAPVFLKDNASFIARVFSGRHVFAFPCTVLTTVNKPYPHVHLSYPTLVQGLNVRKSVRARTRIIVAYNRADGIAGAGIMEDMGAGGALLVSKIHYLEVGDEIDIKFKFTVGDSDYLLRVPCTVRGVRSAGEMGVDDDSVGYGLEFRPLTAEDRLLITAYVYQHALESRSGDAAASSTGASGAADGNEADAAPEAGGENAATAAAL